MACLTVLLMVCDGQVVATCASSDTLDGDGDSWVRCLSLGEDAWWWERRSPWSYRAEERLAERLLQAGVTDAAIREQKQRWGGGDYWPGTPQLCTVTWGSFWAATAVCQH